MSSGYLFIFIYRCSALIKADLYHVDTEMQATVLTVLSCCHGGGDLVEQVRQCEHVKS
jgi:hypothetical protein